jgi:hypothetical protein
MSGEQQLQEQAPEQRGENLDRQVEIVWKRVK